MKRSKIVGVTEKNILMPKTKHIIFIPLGWQDFEVSRISSFLTMTVVSGSNHRITNIQFTMRKTKSLDWTNRSWRIVLLFCWMEVIANLNTKGREFYGMNASFFLLIRYTHCWVDDMWQKWFDNDASSIVRYSRESW